jgi:hypothetical protein
LHLIARPDRSQAKASQRSARTQSNGKKKKTSPLLRFFNPSRADPRDRDRDLDHGPRRTATSGLSPFARDICQLQLLLLPRLRFKAKNLHESILGPLAAIWTLVVACAIREIDLTTHQLTHAPRAGSRACSVGRARARSRGRLRHIAVGRHRINPSLSAQPSSGGTYHNVTIEPGVSSAITPRTETYSSSAGCHALKAPHHGQ